MSKLSLKNISALKRLCELLGSYAMEL